MTAADRATRRGAVAQSSAWPNLTKSIRSLYKFSIRIFLIVYKAAVPGRPVIHLIHTHVQQMIDSTEDIESKENFEIAGEMTR